MNHEEGLMEQWEEERNHAELWKASRKRKKPLASTEEEPDSQEVSQWKAHIETEFVE